VGARVNDIRLIGSISLVLILGLAIVGMDWVTRVQMGLLFLLLIAQVITGFTGSRTNFKMDLLRNAREIKFSFVFSSKFLKIFLNCSMVKSFFFNLPFFRLISLLARSCLRQTRLGRVASLATTAMFSMTISSATIAPTPRAAKRTASLPSSPFSSRPLPVLFYILSITLNCRGFLLTNLKNIKVLWLAQIWAEISRIPVLPFPRWGLQEELIIINELFKKTYTTPF